ncbi:hypothetical protein GF386_00260 [Candidatus Pacearchaeota archaeon]|nr:hypothetical protein [Candidatus Pacearchaeota archaeon]MBD3282715.1 hypothetical protein [Candidatus Pacearchaeota archaeon]
MTSIINKSRVRKIVKELDESGTITNVAEELEDALEKKVIDDLKRAIHRAKANQRRTLFSRDL